MERQATNISVNILNSFTIIIIIETLFLGLPPPSIRIKDALEECPIKVNYFKTETTSERSCANKFNDNLLNALDNYLTELRPKTYSFITDGIESKTDIANLAMSDRQLKKANKVSDSVLALREIAVFSRDDHLSVSDIILLPSLFLLTPPVSMPLIEILLLLYQDIRLECKADETF